MFSNVTVLCGYGQNNTYTKHEEISFDFHVVNWKNFFGFRFTPFLIYFNLAKNSDVIIHFGDIKYATFFYSLLMRFLYRKKLFIHGQGSFQKSGILKKLLYNLMMPLCDGYISYNEYVSTQLKSILLKRSISKIHTVNNSLYLSSVNKPCYAPNQTIAFIGRVRDGANIELLAKAANILKLKLLMVGEIDDQQKFRLNTYHDDIVYYGPVYDIESIKNQLSQSLVGVYPGDAGLSVVHLMSLGLPVIVHSSLCNHMGPEPWYIIDGFNGCLFERGSLNDLVRAINNLNADLDYRNNIASNALNFFLDLNRHSMGCKIYEIIKSEFDNE